MLVKKKILIVDDEPDILKTTGIALKSEGLEVITAISAEEALEKLPLVTPDLLVLDVMLPTLSGYEVANIIKADEKYRQIPIILITALTQKCEEELALCAGVDGYLKKPFDLDRLINKIKELLKLG